MVLFNIHLKKKLHKHFIHTVAVPWDAIDGFKHSICSLLNRINYPHEGNICNTTDNKQINLVITTVSVS